jgi:hypothetical protein
LARRPCENGVQISKTWRQAQKLLRREAANVCFDDGRSWMVGPVGLRRIAVALHGEGYSPAGLPESVAEPAGTSEEVQCTRSGVIGVDVLPPLVAERHKNALPAGWLPASTNSSPVVDKIDMQALAEARRDDGLEGVVVWLISLGVHDPETGEDPRNMGIDGELLPIERVGHHATRRLYTYAREPEEERLDLGVRQTPKVFQRQIRARPDRNALASSHVVLAHVAQE